MIVKDLTTQFEYGWWANSRLFHVASALTPQQFIQPVAGSYGSIRNTSAHMMSTEWGWLERCGGPKRGPKLSASDYPTLASIREKWEQVEKQIRCFLGELHDEDLSRIVEFGIGDGPKESLSIGEMLQHAATHGVHHRGQIALLLRSLGHTPGDVDMLFYFRQLRNGIATA
jgi:uncharacterized damage-inducible protein DinB